MSNFQNPYQKIAWLERRLNALESMVRRVIQPSGVVSTGTTGGPTIVGVTLVHDHSGAGEGGKVEYAPAVYANWTSGLDPGGVWEALDQLAARVTVLDSSAPAAVTMMLMGMEV